MSLRGVHRDVSALSSGPKGELRTAPTLTGVVGFERVLPAWQALGDNARYFFQTPQWAACLSGHIAGDVVLGALVEGHRPVAVLMLRRSSRRRWGINLKVLYGPGHLEEFRLFGDGLLAPEADERCSFDEITRHLGPWHGMRLSRLRIGSPWLALADDRAYVEEEPGEGVGVLDTRRNPDAWWREMPKNMRGSIREARRKIGEERRGRSRRLDGGGRRCGIRAVCTIRKLWVERS